MKDEQLIGWKWKGNIKVKSNNHVDDIYICPAENYSLEFNLDTLMTREISKNLKTKLRHAKSWIEIFKIYAVYRGFPYVHCHPVSDF